jgi:DNA-binding response OmpR family regulator
LPFEFNERDSAGSNCESSSSHPSVLIVEDDPAMRRLLELELGRQGFDVFLVSSAKEARQAMEALVFPIAVIDRKLADADGVELIEELRVRYADHRTYVVLFSVLDSAADQELGMNAGADAYVSKAYFPAALVNELTKAMEVVRLHKR